MKLTTLLGAIAGLGSAAAYQDVRKNFEGHRVVHLNDEHLTKEVRALLTEVGGDHIGLHDEGFAVKLDHDAVRHLESKGIPMEDATEQWIEHFQSNFDNPRLFCRGTDKECSEKEFQDFYASYQTNAAIQLRVAATTADLDYANTFTLAQSYEGRDIQMTEIGDPEKPLAFFICNIHAREWTTPLYCSHMIEQLVADGGHPLLETFSFAIITAGNPDGYEFSRAENNMWRKTRKPNDNSTCFGTDPNRNYDDHHCGAGTSNDPCSDHFCGVEAFDQPETAAIEAYGNAHADNLIVWIDFHSFGGYWMSPMGYEGILPPLEDYEKMYTCMNEVRIAVRQIHQMDITIGAVAQVYSDAAGSSIDWFYLNHGVIYAYGAELRGPTFQPEPENIIPSNAEIFAGMVANMECVKRLELTEAETPEEPEVDGDAPISGTDINTILNFITVSLVLVALVFLGTNAKNKKAAESSTEVKAAGVSGV